MGVMECQRKDCDEIMCNEYLEGIVYICYSCLDELQKTNPTSYSNVETFMDYSKKETKFLDENGNFSLLKVLGHN